MTGQDSTALVEVPLAKLEPHPANANLMSDDLRKKLAANIRRSGKYPPLIVRPIGDGQFQLLDGEQRWHVLRDLGETHAWCVTWKCSNEDALLLLATLNRLEGQDVPGRRAALVAELSAQQSLAELARLLPEDEAELSATLALADLDVDGLLERLTQEAERAAAESAGLFSFAVEPADAPSVEAALGKADGRPHRKESARQGPGDDRPRVRRWR